MGCSYHQKYINPVTLLNAVLDFFSCQRFSPLPSTHLLAVSRRCDYPLEWAVSAISHDGESCAIQKQQQQREGDTATNSLSRIMMHGGH
jgi:hypothetical protein